ncbi:MAG TPA: hypothetical protein VEF34_06510 [Syntrophobacteraceae bacterium]|nr:hypothetical protein [Syntrophobacteraceae bacterium]
MKTVLILPEPVSALHAGRTAVRNILAFVERMRCLPAFVTKLEGGLGFAEIAQIILKIGKRGSADGRSKKPARCL